MRIALTGGGSGGHIYPLLAVTEALKNISVENAILMEIKYFGPKDSYGAILEKTGVKISPIAAGKVRRYFSLLNIVDVPKFFVGLVQAFFKMFWFMPDVLFSKGGTGAFPTVLAAWFYRIPVIIHESDAAPGLNNLLSAPFSSRIAVSFESASKYFNPRKTAWTGNPMRRQLFENRLVQETAKTELGFDAQKPLILIICGSQGSQRINNLVLVVLKDLIADAQILHQTGKGNFAEVQKLSRTALLDVKIEKEIASRYKPVPYLELTVYESLNLKTAFSAADLIVARAGSNTIFEIASFGKPSILIPLAEAANGHQKANAYEFEKNGSAIVIEEENLLPGIFVSQIKDLLKQPQLLQKMAQSAAQFFKPDADKILAEEIVKLAA